MRFKKIQAKEISIDGVKYYYTTTEDSNKKKAYHIFKYSADVNGYIPLQQHELPYSDIMKHLLKIPKV